VSQRELSSDEQARIVAIACGLARGGRTSELSEFVEHGLDVDSTDSEGNSLLMLAAYRGATDTVRMLLDKGADPNLLNAKNQSILAGALFKGETDIVTSLIAAGADLDIGSPTARDTAAMFKQQHLLGDA
jgi:uncharacterized protein